MSEMLRGLATRRSVLASMLSEPGPSDSELSEILKIGARVPDHGKLAPWRYIVFSGKARSDFGAFLARTFKEKNPDVNDERLCLEEGRFMRAPVVVCVVSSIKNNPKIPHWEQQLSAGAVCQNILLATIASGYAAQWITEWYAYDEDVALELGLASLERVAGFIYIGSKTEPMDERRRPDMDEITHFWKR